MPLRVLVWQWGRRGAGPRFAVELARHLARLPAGVTAQLSLSTAAEVLAVAHPPACDLAVATYRGWTGLIGRILTGPCTLILLCRQLRRLRPDLAICAMSAPLDLLMAAALAILGVPFALIVHEVDAHPGDRFRLQYHLQALLIRRAALLVPLSRHVAARLRRRPDGPDILLGCHPPFPLAGPPPAPAADGALRLLLFGRLLEYKGLDLLADGMARLVGIEGREVRLRVVGLGPESAALARLRALPNVAVENRWVPEAELPALFAWPHLVVLTHTEASQSGVAALALGAGRRIIATRVGGLEEQLAAMPAVTFCAPDAADLCACILAQREAALPASSQPDAARVWTGLAEAIVARLAAHRRAVPANAANAPIGAV